MHSDPDRPQPPRDADQDRLGAGRERRLHPLSWLFVLFDQIRSLSLPLILLVLFGRGHPAESAGWLWLALLASSLLVLAALMHYFTFRFRIDAGELVLRSGLLQRNVRHVPLARIQSVTLHRKLLHRLTGVAEVRLESAVGGSTPEAQMRVLSMDDARALERLVERHRSLAPSSPETVTAGPAPTPAARMLLHLPPSELVKLGLSSNRGLILVGAGLGLLLDTLGDFLIDSAKDEIQRGLQGVLGYGLQLLPWLLIGLLVLIVVVLGAQLVSVLLTVLRDYDFKLEQAGPRLSVERGLLTRVRASSPLRRIQRWNLHDNLLLRLFKRQRLSVETAASRQGNHEQSISDLIPIANPHHIQHLLQQWLPDWPAQIAFEPLHPKAWRRFFVPMAVLILMLSALALPIYGPASFLLLALLPPWVVIAHRRAAACGYALTDSFLIWRSGWLNRRISFAPIAKLQGLKLVQTPFDRRLRMARLHADTAGAPVFGQRLHLIHLPETQARQLYHALSTRIAHSPWQW